MAVMYVWTEEWGNSFGHASLSLYDNIAYISWWPTGDKSKNCMKKKKSVGKTKECVPVDYEDDRDNFTRREYTHRFYIWISAKGVEKIRNWWENNKKDKGGYHFVLNNCCDVVVQALRKGGFEIDMSLLRMPGDMVGLGNELENETKDEALNEDVKRWKKIRHETPLRLKALKQGLHRAKRQGGGILLVGALLAPFTWGASMVGAVAMTTSTLINETRNVIETTQAAVNKDKTETIRLRQRVTHFQGIENFPFAAELFTLHLNTIFIFDLSEHSIWSILNNWIGTGSALLLNYDFANLEMFTRNLESELNTVEKVHEKYAMP